MEKLKACADTITSKISSDAVLLLLRIVVGVIFIQAGWGKLLDMDRTIGFFGNIGIPMPVINAWLATLTELIGGAMILVGYKVRYAGLPLAFVMLVAIITTELGSAVGFSEIIRLQQLDYLLIFLLIGAIGAGKYSLDNK